nr:unnamed protein product [Haemonchus contortus]
MVTKITSFSVYYQNGEDESDCSALKPERTTPIFTFVVVAIVIVAGACIAAIRPSVVVGGGYSMMSSAIGNGILTVHDRHQDAVLHQTSSRTMNAAAILTLAADESEWSFSGFFYLYRWQC